MDAVVSLSHMVIRPQPGTRVYFISDVHLGFGSRQQDVEREALLLMLLRRIAADAAHVFIVGDLFDAWFDYRTAVPRHHVRTLAQLAAMREAGIPITYLMGNHDFGHDTYFRDDLAIEPLGGDVEATIGSTRFYIAHGDGKAHGDKGYLLLKSVLRHPLAQRMYRWLHPDIGIRLASGTSEKSRSHTDKKDYGQTDGLRDFAVERLAQGYDIVIMGHRHQVCSERIDQGLYINLGHWLGTDPTFGVFQPETAEMVVVSVSAFLGRTADNCPVR